MGFTGISSSRSSERNYWFHQENTLNAISQSAKQFFGWLQQDLTVAFDFYDKCLQVNYERHTTRNYRARRAMQKHDSHS